MTPTYNVFSFSSLLHPLMPDQLIAGVALVSSIRQDHVQS